jgi:NTE family protein
MIKYILSLAVLLMFSSLTLDLAAQQNISGRPKVGLVLSGGGAKGFAHIGVLKVLEESGLKIDYIGGTSMGSIVGGLYSIGYDADTLQNLVFGLDWNKLLSDDISRRDLSIEEKPDYDRFIINFPLRERKIALPAGMITGQNIENQMAELCSHVNHIRNFDNLNIPYLCVAADVETGQEMVFRNGYLPMCMRASMAIPSVFAPMKIDGKLYVDGGVVNNFPVDHVKSMGADIIIGVDVGYQPKTTKNYMNLLSVMEQTVFMASLERTQNNRELCDILIKPDLTGYNTASFTSGDSLIVRGERAAMEYFDRFKAMADSLNNIEYIPYEKTSFMPSDSVLLREIRIDGMENVSGSLVKGKLNLEVLEKVTPAMISKSVSDLYSSLFFEKVTYELEPMDDEPIGEGVRLIVRVTEREEGQLKVGLNYNSTYKASIILNTTFRNLILHGSKTSLNLALGENQFALGRFEKNNGWKPGLVVEIGAQNFDLDLYNEESRYAVLNYSDAFARVFSQSIINNSYSFGFGGEFERTLLRPETGPSIPDRRTDHNYGLLAFIDLDTYDNRFYPEKGTRMQALYKYIKSPARPPVSFLRFNLEQATGIGRKLTIIPRVYGGFSTADTSLIAYRFYLGGLNKTARKGMLPFVGLDFMERSGRNVLAAGLDIQYKLWKSNYLILRANAANTSHYFEDIIRFDSIVSGFGITYGNLSFIGPVEFTLMRPGHRHGMIFYVNIGYYF